MENKLIRNGFDQIIKIINMQSSFIHFQQKNIFRCQYTGPTDVGPFSLFEWNSFFSVHTQIKLR